MELTLIFKIAAIGIIIAVLNQVLSKSGRDEYAMLTVIAGIAAVAMILIPQIEILYDMVCAVFDL